MFAYDRGWQHRLHRSGDDRPDRGSRRRARAVGHPRPHAARHRPLSARAAARSRRTVEPADAPVARPGLCAGARPAAGERGAGRALDGAGGAARIRPQAPARAGAGGRRPQLPRRHCRARARHPGRGRDCQCHRRRRSRRPDHCRWRGRRRACATFARHGGRLCRAGAAAGAPAIAIPRAARPTLRHQGRRAGDAPAQRRACGRPAAYRGDRRRRHRAVPHRAAVHGGGDSSRAPPSSSRSTARCSTPPATSR